MSESTRDGWSDAQKYLAVILASLALLGMVAGSVYAWTDMQFRLNDACNRIGMLETRQEKALTDSLRIERKVDRLLIEQGVNPDDIR